jgi:uncharacterized membrane protein
MRKTLKFLHTLAGSGLIGALAGYAILLAYAPQTTPQDYADVRQTILLLCNYLLLPSLAVVLVSGLLAMAAHKPFLDQRWVWVKALFGISMFEGTLIIIQGRANQAAKVAADIAAGRADQATLVPVIATEWGGLIVISLIAIGNIVLAVWRPKLAK